MGRILRPLRSQDNYRCRVEPEGKQWTWYAYYQDRNISPDSRPPWKIIGTGTSRTRPRAARKAGNACEFHFRGLVDAIVDAEHETARGVDPVVLAPK